MRIIDTPWSRDWELGNIPTPARLEPQAHQTITIKSMRRVRRRVGCGLPGGVTLVTKDKRPQTPSAQLMGNYKLKSNSWNRYCNCQHVCVSPCVCVCIDQSLIGRVNEWHAAPFGQVRVEPKNHLTAVKKAILSDCLPEMHPVTLKICSTAEYHCHIPFPLSLPNQIIIFGCPAQLAACVIIHSFRLWVHHNFFHCLFHVLLHVLFASSRTSFWVMCQMRGQAAKCFKFGFHSSVWQKKKTWSVVELKNSFFNLHLNAFKSFCNKPTKFKCIYH